MPCFSVVIPCLNAAATIGETLDSIRRQSFGDWEAIVVDDGSTDATPRIVAEFARRDPRINLVRNPGKGPSMARNVGAGRFASGDIVSFCDADDLWSADKLAETRRVFLSGDADAAYGRITFFRTRPGDTATVSTVPRGALTIPVLLGENPVCTTSNLSICRQVFMASGGFDPTMVHNEDLEFLIRIVGQGARVLGLDSLQVWYRTSTGGLSANLDAMRAGRECAVRTARAFGVEPDGRAEAVHLRYLARRALRVESGEQTALHLTLEGMGHSLPGFLFPLRRGLATALAALIAPLLPRALRTAIFN